MAGATPSTPIQYLFRFRDLIAPTLREHRKIIERHGCCLWGWWKRPTEGDREDVWRNLAKETATNPVMVGLFDSGLGEVYVASVVGVIEPYYASNIPPPIPQENDVLVPEYYRASPFSRAWMRFKEIKSEPLNFFGRYSFDVVPRLPYYSDAVLNRLHGKVIQSPDELRGMDTTIWKVRPKQESDSDKEIILTIHSLSEPVTAKSVDITANTILHISDPHYALGKNRSRHMWTLESETGRGKPTLVDAIKGAISDKNIGIVLVTGDLTFTGDQKEFEEARASLFKLLGLLQLDVDRLVVVPGNHDIRWTKSEVYDEDSVVTEAPEEARANYCEFYAKLFRHKVNSTLSMGRRFLTPSGIALEICAVNSSSLEQGKDFLAGMGRIEESAFEGVATALHWNFPSLSFRIMALHHHLMLTENLEPVKEYGRGFGIAVDATRITRLAARYGVQLAIHGHKHRAFLWRSGVYELPEHAQQKYQLGDISLIGGGSAGSSDTEGENNYFNLLQIENSSLRIEMYRAHNCGIFQPMSVWSADLNIDGDPPRLALSPWSKEALD